MTSGEILAHGIGSREDLPLPLSLVLVGSALAVIVSFAALGLLWHAPRLDRPAAGVPLPPVVQRWLDADATRIGLRIAGVLMTSYVVLAAVAGRDDALNPTAGAVYVLFWIGMPLLSVVFGPIWRLLNPLRAAHGLLSRAFGLSPQEGVIRLPDGVGYWPAAVSLYAFVWLELVAPGNTTLPVLRTFFAAYAAVNLIAASLYGRRWFDRGDGFEVYSAVVARLSPLGRREDGRLVLRHPLVGLATARGAPGLFGVVGVLLGSTAYDSLSNAPWWVSRVHDAAFPRLIETLTLTVVIVLVAAAFAGAAAASGTAARAGGARAGGLRAGGLRAGGLAGEFAHTIVPIVVGYVIAHYWSLLVLVGQATVIRLSDPLGIGADWLGTAERGVDPTLAQPGLVAILQVAAIVGGHVVAVILAHDRAMRLFERRRAIAGQVPFLVVMLAYTVGGLSLLFAS